MLGQIMGINFIEILLYLEKYSPGSKILGKITLQCVPDPCFALSATQNVSQHIKRERVAHWNHNNMNKRKKEIESQM